jgi:starvation-inducible DNA-binding protein
VRDLGEALQDVLVDLVDLSLLGKHAHWNVEGLTFRSLHLQLDELVDDWRALSDDVAERAATLGFAPDAQAATVARASRIDALPAGRISDRDVVAGLADRLADVIGRTRNAMGEAAVRDSITEDLLIEVVKALEKQQWMLRAQRRPH